MVGKADIEKGSRNDTRVQGGTVMEACHFILQGMEPLEGKMPHGSCEISHQNLTRLKEESVGTWGQG